MLRRASSLLLVYSLLMLGAWSYAHAWPAHGIPSGSPPPVITNASLSFQTPATNGATVGTLSATGSPTSWAITAGNPGGGTGFAINSAGVITISTASVFGATSGSATLTVTATNAFGTDTNPNIIINWVPSGSPPVINTASFSFQTPTTTGATVGTLTATGSPTSWAITAGNTSNGFAISNAGIITIASAAVFGSSSGSTTLTVTATNVFGTGTNSNIAITWTPSGAVPVIANASFAFTTPVTTGALVGTLSATGSPTTWFITAGNTICGFVIDNSGNITITTGSLFGSGSGSETLTVTAVNSFGTGTNSNIIISWGPSGIAPVITNASFSITTPVSSGGNVGTLSATGSPTSWAITAGDPSGNFAISNSGVITTTTAAVTNLGTNSGSQTLTVTATNAFGTGTNSNIIINYAPFNPQNCSNTTIANLPLGNFTLAAQNNGSVVANSDSTLGITATNYTVVQSSFTAPASCVYTFTVNAFQTANPGITNQNAIYVFIDGQPIPATGATVGNWWTQLVTNASPAVGYQFSVPLVAANHIISVGFMINQVANLVSATQGVHGDRIIVAETNVSTIAEPSGSRDPYNFPYSSLHFINTAIGTGIVWSNNTSSDDTSLHSGSVNINYNSFTTGFFEGQSTDPIGTWTNTSTAQPFMDFNGTNPHHLHMSTSTVVAPGTDSTSAIADATNPRYIYGGNASSFSSSGPSLTVNTGFWVDAYSQNQSIEEENTGGGAMGMIRVADINAGVIAHTLALATQYSQMAQPPTSRQGLGWPVNDADFACVGASPSLCVGSLQWGSLIGIPSVAQGGPNCSSLGLTAVGLMLCHALQNYGAIQYINSGNANSPVNTLYGEYAPSNSTYQTAMGQLSSAWGTLQTYLRIARNNIPANFFTGNGTSTCAAAGCAKGGGTPLVAQLPGLVSGLATLNFAPAPPASQTPFAISGVSFGNATGAHLTTTVDAPIHSTVIVFLFGQNSIGSSFSSVTLGNSSPCSINASTGSATLTTIAIATCVNLTSDLPVGSSITVNGSFGSGTWVGSAVAAIGVTGGVDKTATQLNTTAAQTFTFTGPTLSQASELVCADFSGGVGANFGAITEQFNSLVTTELAVSPYYGAGCTVVSSTAGPIYNPKWAGVGAGGTPTASNMVTLKIP